MKRSHRKILFASLALLSGFVGSQPAIAGAYPDRPGQCYFFRGETLEMHETCTLSTGYGAGAQYVILNWSDGVKTKIFNLTVCKNGGNCGSTVDDVKATFYSRDLFLKPTEEKDEQELTCYAIHNNDNSICYRFKS